MTTPAYNCILSFPNYIDPSVLYTPVGSGGSWSAGNPLTNLQNRRPKKVARSTDATTGSTQFDWDLGVARALRVLAILVRNATAAATVRIRVSTVAGDFSTPVYDSTAALILPAGKTKETLHGLNVWKTFVPSADQTGRYVRAEINDTANPDTFLDVGRAWFGPGWQPSVNMSYGVSTGVEDLTEQEDTDGGATTYNAKANRRVTAFSIDDLPADEAMSNSFDIKRLAGRAKQVFYVFDPTDATHGWRRNFAGGIRTLSALKYPYFASASDAYEIAEDL